jgi:hypothetical protein
LAFFCDNDKRMPRSRLRWKYTEEDMAEAILDVTDTGFSPLKPLIDGEYLGAL